jgi:transcriptional regulator with XRE-family HTH domain
MIYAVTAARAFDRACQLTGLSGAELSRQLSASLGRRTSLSRQTLTAWRRGSQSVPFSAFLAAADLARLRPPMIFALSADEFDERTIRPFATGEATRGRPAGG